MVLFSKSHQESLGIDFRTIQKIIKLAGHIINEMEDKVGVSQRGEVHIIYSVESLLELGAIRPEVVDDYYDNQENIPGIVFQILEGYLSENLIGEDNEGHDFSLISRQLVFSRYKQLGELLGKEIHHEFQNFLGNKLLTDQRSLEKKLENPTLDILSIFLSGSQHSNNNDSTKIDNYVNLLWDLNIISQDDRVRLISSDDIEFPLYDTLKNKVFGVHISDDHYLSECFREYSDAYTRQAMYKFKSNISGQVSEKLEEKYNPRIADYIMDGIDLTVHPDLQDQITTFDRNELLELLKENNLLSRRESILLQVTPKLNDFFRYVIFILDGQEYFETLHDDTFLEMRKYLSAFRLSDIDYPIKRVDLPSISQLQDKKVLREYFLQIVTLTQDSQGEFMSHAYLDEVLDYLISRQFQNSIFSEIFGLELDDLYDIPDIEERLQYIAALLFCDFLDDNTRDFGGDIYAYLKISENTQGFVHILEAIYTDDDSIEPTE